ncbi:MAG: hypothetical protein P8Q89_02020, partial [Alphaproteobacteria bacterium]|nr:hypothetical protein [Alphaproteobacteria bacterium]
LPLSYDSLTCIIPMRVYIAILNQIAKRSFECIYVPFTASKAFDALFIKLFVWLLVGCEFIYVNSI